MCLCCTDSSFISNTYCSPWMDKTPVVKSSSLLQSCTIMGKIPYPTECIFCLILLCKDVTIVTEECDAARRWCCVDSCIHAEEFTDSNKLVPHTPRERVISQPKQTHTDMNLHIHAFTREHIHNTHSMEKHTVIYSGKHASDAHTYVHG